MLFIQEPDVKADLDNLMAARGFDALVVLGPAAENHALHYLANGAKISDGILLKKRGEAPLLVCSPMERDEAAKSGLPLATHNDFDLHKLIQEKGSYFEAEVHMLAALFERQGVAGTVSFYGLGDPGQSYMMLSRLAEICPTLRVVGETETTVFDEAYTTKDPAELAAIKSVAARTNTVMAEAVDFLKSHKAQEGRLVKADGSPLTIAEVKRFVRGRLLDYDLEDSEMIFAIGRDAGVPHSRGEADDPLALGRSIIFDLFPRELGGGYYHDMTRTFCLGYAPPEVKEVYDQVMFAFHAVMEALAVGEKAASYQTLVNDTFEAQGHPTTRSHPGTVEGYVHSLGHGLGLQIHSRPRFSPVSEDVVEPGQVFTVEPGLYYPERGYGVRIEDTVYVDEAGAIHSLTPFPKDLVIPVEGR
jgi:Xaa-Pro aminopeptidase